MIRGNYYVYYVSPSATGDVTKQLLGTRLQFGVAIALDSEATDKAQWRYDADANTLSRVIDSIRMCYFRVTQHLIDNATVKAPLTIPTISTDDGSLTVMVPPGIPLNAMIPVPVTSTLLNSIHFKGVAYPLNTYVKLTLDGQLLLLFDDGTAKQITNVDGVVEPTYGQTYFVRAASVGGGKWRFTKMYDPINPKTVSWFSTQYAPGVMLDVSQYDRTKQMFNCWYGDDGGDCNNDSQTTAGGTAWCAQDDGTYTRRCGVSFKPVGKRCPEFSDNRTPLVFQRTYNLVDRDKCAYTKTLNASYDKQNQERCFRADPSVMTRSGKLNSEVCALTKKQSQVYGWNIPGETSGGTPWWSDNPDNDRYLTDSAWAPWTSDSLGSAAMIDYCSQHDNITNTPVFQADARCQNVLANPNNAAVKQKIQTQYCQLNPGSERFDCATWCGAGTGDNSCFNTFSDYCNGENLKTSVCKNWCALSNTNCDARLLDLCSKEPSLLTTDPNVCGCFQPSQFYNDYFNGLNNSVMGLNSFTGLNLPTRPDCYFPFCANKTALQPYSIKQPGAANCPNIQQCISVVNYEGGGVINNGNVVINNSTDCSWAQPSCDLTKQISITTGCSQYPEGCVVCQDCPADTKPSSDGKRCEAAGGGGGGEVYDWVIGEWGSCINGSQSRNVVCANQDTGVRVDDSKCGQTKPATVQSCGGGGGGDTYTYIVSDWGSCGKTCQQSRTVACFDDTTNAKVDNQKCVEAGLVKPKSTQDCTGGECASGGSKSTVILIGLLVVGVMLVMLFRRRK